MSKQKFDNMKNLPSLKSTAVFMKEITYEEVDGKSYWPHLFLTNKKTWYVF